MIAGRLGRAREPKGEAVDAAGMDRTAIEQGSRRRRTLPSTPQSTRERRFKTLAGPRRVQVAAAAAKRIADYGSERRRTMMTRMLKTLRVAGACAGLLAISAVGALAQGQMPG